LQFTSNSLTTDHPGYKHPDPDLGGERGSLEDFRFRPIIESTVNLSITRISKAFFLDPSDFQSEKENQEPLPKSLDVESSINLLVSLTEGRGEGTAG
jgi:hypothetical protein